MLLRVCNALQYSGNAQCSKIIVLFSNTEFAKYLCLVFCVPLYSTQSPSLFQSENQSNSATSSQEERIQPVSNNTSLSPRQRRAQQRRVPTSTNFNQVQQPRVNTSHMGSNVLILLLILALAALIFRRIYLANEYIFEL